MRFRIGEWEFEGVQFRGRKVVKHGKPYSAQATITVADGEPHVEGVMSLKKLTRTDKETLNKVIIFLEHDGYTCSHFDDEEERIVTRVTLKDQIKT